MHKRNGGGVLIPKNALVKITQMNHIVEIQYMEKMNTSSKIRKLDKEHYVDLSTGEKKEFVQSENRKDNLNSLRQTFKKLRYLINNNFVGKSNELHIILTYKNNMTDSKQLYKDFDRFIKRLRYEYKDKSSIDYLTVVEPQGRGAWHCHVLMRFNDLDSVYIKNSKLRSLWGLGFVMIKPLEDVDNIGAYLSAYLTDMELTEENGEDAFRSEVKIVKDKKYIKGGRLDLYPPGMNLYRKSKGIIPPDRISMSYEKAKKKVGYATPHFSKSYDIEIDDFTNLIAYEQYNMKRK